MDEKCTSNDGQVLNHLHSYGCIDSALLLSSLAMIIGLPMCLPNIVPLYLSDINCGQPCLSQATLLTMLASVAMLALLSIDLLLLITSTLLALRLVWRSY